MAEMNKPSFYLQTQNAEWQTDPWCRYLPDLHRSLADPAACTNFPRSFVGLGHEDSCAWWETLRYLFRTLLGWRNLPVGLIWWHKLGRPHLNAPLLRLVLERWDSRQELDFFAAREWESGGGTGFGDDSTASPPGITFEPSPGWWQEFRRRDPLPGHSPYGGGYNPLHLGHSDGMCDHCPAGPLTGFHDVETRRAVLIVHGFGSWCRELRDFGVSLPNLGNHSWHVEVFDRQIGYLGLFRRSRVTGLWFQGKHSIHIAGNPGSSIDL